MNHLNVTLDPGLYIVATPLGCARDITLRALDVLANATTLAAEDTRSARKLMDLHGIALNGRKIIPYHDHSPAHVRSDLMERIKSGESIGYVSEAGTPLIADPGFHLVGAVRSEGLPVTSVPGPSAPINALALSGMPTDQFHFLGFLPTASGARRTALESALTYPATIVLFESPKRVTDLADLIADMAGPDRKVAMCREMTKKFEEMWSGPVGDLIVRLHDAPPKGEIVFLIQKADAAQHDAADVETALIKAMVTMRVKDAANTVAGAFGMPKRDVYQMALKLQDKTK